MSYHWYAISYVCYIGYRESLRTSHSHHIIIPVRMYIHICVRDTGALFTVAISRNTGALQIAPYIYMYICILGNVLELGCVLVNHRCNNHRCNNHRWNNHRCNNHRCNNHRWSNHRWNNHRWNNHRCNNHRCNNHRWNNHRWNNHRWNNHRWNNHRWNNHRCNNHRCNNHRWNNHRWNNHRCKRNSYSLHVKIQLLQNTSGF